MENQLSIRDQLLAVIKNIIEDNIGNERFSVADLAKEVGLSRSMLHRRLISLTGKSATELITEMRMTRALELLENDIATVSEIAYRVGYSSPSYFTKVFKKIYKVSPGDVRQAGSGKFSHLKVVNEPGVRDSIRNKRSRSYAIAGLNMLMLIIVTGGAVFLILDFKENMSPFSGVPAWLMIFIIVLLGTIFLISVILSRAFDPYPDEGTVKTGRAHRVIAGKKQPSPNRWKIARYVSFLVIVCLIVLNAIPRGNQSNGFPLQENSIAVLPFVNDSPDKDYGYFIDGFWAEMLINLQAIEDFVVHGRSSTEQYRNHSKSVPEIARELGVNYLVEASGQRYGNTIKLWVALLDGKTGSQIWSNSFEEEIESVEIIMNIQSRIAEDIANKLQAVISPEERELIDKIPTTSLTAHEFYLRGNEELRLFDPYAPDSTILENAENLFQKALSDDPDFAEAYLGLARVYWQKYYSDEFLFQNFMDSAMVLAENALRHNERLAGAYLLMGDYYSETGNLKLARKEYDKGIRYNPNDWRLYHGKSIIYRHNDMVIAFESAFKAAALNRGPELADLLSVICSLYLNIGLNDRALELEEKILILTGDSASYYHTLAYLERKNENYLKEHELLLSACRLDSVYFHKDARLARSYLDIGQYEEALEYYKKYHEYHECSEDRSQLLWSTHRIAYAYSVNGYKSKAEEYFRKQIELSTQENELRRYRTEQYYTYYDLAAVYAFQGEKEKAYENLRIFKKTKYIHRWLVELIHTDWLFDSIRDEPEFQQIISDVEAKYQAEHERVKKWLEENDMM